MVLEQLGFQSYKNKLGLITYTLNHEKMEKLRHFAFWKTLLKEKTKDRLGGNICKTHLVRD